MCKKRPSGIAANATFVIDTHKLDCVDDIKKDDFGIWNYSGSQPQAYKVNTEEGNVSVEKCATSSKEMNVVYLRCLYCTLPSNPRFKWLICFLSGEFPACSKQE